MDKSRRFLMLLLAICMVLASCMSENLEQSNNTLRIDEDVDMPELPQKLKAGEGDVPALNVYDVSKKEVIEMDLEDYVMGVVAGEMKNDWPLEALKAQAILARTFVLKFCDTKNSKYDGADISTDVSEAQAYAPENINDRVRQAVEETRGIVMSDDGEYPYAWFFAHAGGKTELPSVALDYNGEDPDYLEVTDSPDSDKAPEDVKNWSATFSKDQVRKAAEDSGLKIDAVESVEVGKKGESGRAKTLLINGKAVSAPSFRIHIGANKLKSTLIDDIEINGNNVIFSGRGFGHGVGMSQWGAYALAEQGKQATEIVQHYFEGVDIVKLW